MPHIPKEPRNSLYITALKFIYELQVDGVPKNISDDAQEAMEWHEANQDTYLSEKDSDVSHRDDYRELITRYFLKHGKSRKGQSCHAVSPRFG